MGGDEMIDFSYKLYGSVIDGQEKKEADGPGLDVIHPYDGRPIGRIAIASEDDANQAVIAADRVFRDVARSMPAHERARILYEAASLLEANAEAFARLITLESGKVVKESRAEVQRAVQVLKFSAEGAKNLYGELIPMDSAIGGEGRLGMTMRRPIGVVVAITPFNFPLNLVLHKVAPALAAGNTVVLKPAEKTPLTSVWLYRLLQSAGLPQGMMNIVMGPGEKIGHILVTHPLVKKVTFTGSSSVGWQIKEKAVRAKVTLELGSNSPTLVFADAHLDEAAASILKGAFANAGQTCVSVQRVYVQDAVYETMKRKLTEGVSTLKVGDPLDPAVDIGPMITEAAAERVESWVREAVGQGAQVAAGGNRQGSLFEPTVLTDVNPAMKVVCEEAFAPILCLIPFESEEEAVTRANDSGFGLQTGVFTNDLGRALRIADALETGGVWINESSLLRYDHMPYGGIKMSGVGKEGVKYALEEMTERKFVGIRWM